MPILLVLLSVLVIVVTAQRFEKQIHLTDSVEKNVGFVAINVDVWNREEEEHSMDNVKQIQQMTKGNVINDLHELDFSAQAAEQSFFASILSRFLWNDEAEIVQSNIPAVKHTFYFSLPQFLEAANSHRCKEFDYYCEEEIGPQKELPRQQHPLIKYPDAVEYVNQHKQPVKPEETKALNPTIETVQVSKAVQMETKAEKSWLDVMGSNKYIFVGVSIGVLVVVAAAWIWMCVATARSLKEDADIGTYSLVVESAPPVPQIQVEFTAREETHA